VLRTVDDERFRGALVRRCHERALDTVLDAFDRRRLVLEKLCSELERLLHQRFRLRLIELLRHCTRFRDRSCNFCCIEWYLLPVSFDNGRELLL
jgi:hypothetical protein